MRRILALSFLLSFIVNSASAQDNIFNPTGNAGVGIGVIPNVPLDAFHIHRPAPNSPEGTSPFPALRLTLGTTAADRTKFGQLAIQTTVIPATKLSQLTTLNDLVLRTGADGSQEGRGNILVSSQARGRAIGFAVTPTGATNPFPKDLMAMEIASTGRVGIGLLPNSMVGVRNPLDLLHLGHEDVDAVALRLSYTGNGLNDFAQLAIDGDCQQGVIHLTALGNEDCGDLILRNVNTLQFSNPSPTFSGDIIITSQKRMGNIRFGTSPETGSLVGGFPDIERMMINHRGNVVIGAPQSDRAEKLNVHYNLSSGVAQVAPYAALRLSQSDPDQGFALNDMYRNAVFGLCPANGAWSDEAKKNDLMIGTNSGDVLIAASTSGDEPTVSSGVQWNRIHAGAIRMMTRPSGVNPGGHVERLTILSLGNIGVDNPTPTHKLDINGDLNFSGTLNIAHDPGVAGQIIVSNGVGQAPGWATPSTSSLAWAIGGNTGINSTTDFLGTTNDADLVLKTDNIERVRIKGTTGHVWIGAGISGIGLPNDNSLPYQLIVNGTALVREMIVNTSWSDFVFAPDYELLTLSEVEAHISEYGHLPDIPSAAEVEKNGVSLGAISSKLLQKIEELTLYSIAQEKRILELEAKVQTRRQE